MAKGTTKRKVDVISEHVPSEAEEAEPLDRQTSSRRPQTVPTRRCERVRRRLFRFMDLPQELKDLIYHELWQYSAHMLFPHDRYQWLGLRYGSFSATESVDLPKWLLTSQFILHTGLKQLFKEAKWSWSVARRAKYHDRATIGSSPLVGLSVATYLSITGNELTCAIFSGARPYNSSQGLGEIRLSLLPFQVRSALPILSATTSLLKTLKLSMILIIYRDLRETTTFGQFGGAGMRWIVDLSFLDTSTLQLNELAVQLRVTAFSHSADSDKYTNDMRDGLHAEVARVGGRLVGPEGAMSVNTIGTIPYEFSPHGSRGRDGYHMDQPFIIDCKFAKKK